MTPDASDPRPLDESTDDLLREVVAEAEADSGASDSVEVSGDEVAEAASAEVHELEDPTVKLQTELAQSKDRWLRAVAELENVRKRSRREVQTSTNLARANLLRELLEVVDNFDRALDSATWDDQDAAVTRFAEGVRMIRKQFVEILNQNGLERIEARGAAFDPNLHEAISQIETDEVPSQHVVQVVQEGYRLNDLVVRPARVVVAV